MVWTCKDLSCSYDTAWGPAVCPRSSWAAGLARLVGGRDPVTGLCDSPPRPRLRARNHRSAPFLCVFCFFLDSTCKRDQTVFVSLYLTHFTAHNALKVQPRFRKWQGFLLFHGWIVLCFARLCTAFSLSIHPSRATSCSGMGVQRSF